MPRPRKPEAQKPHRYAFALDPKKDEQALRNLVTWFEFCHASIDPPVGGWTKNSMIKALFLNLSDSMIVSSPISPADADISAGFKILRKLIREEGVATRRLIADLQVASPQQSHTSYGHSNNTQDLGYVSNDIGETDWIDVDE